MQASLADGSQQWHTVLEGARPGVVTIGGLDAAAAYAFRLVLVHAGQSAGASATSPPSLPSPPLLTDARHLRLLEPLEASAISSSSYALSWLHAARSTCITEHTYSVQMRRAAGNAGGGIAATGSDEWTTVRKSATGAAIEVTGVACPTGCSFRYRTEGIRGWSLYSQPTQYVPTHALSAIPAGAERLEPRLATQI